MGDILTAEVQIRGTRPILWHAFDPDRFGERGEKAGTPGKNPDEWRKSYLATDDRQLYIPPEYVFGCIRDGGKNTKKGRGSLQSLIAATLQVEDEIILTDRFMPEEDPPVNDLKALVYIDVRGVIMRTGSGAHNVRYRVAASPGWQMTFHILWDKTIISRGEMETATRDAGRLCGLADARKIGMGRFALERFNVADL